MQIEQITDAASLGSLLADARTHGRCAIDTEFVWERTYAPVLCLVQLATPDRLAVIDPLRGAPLEPIAELMADPAVKKVMHAPAADLAGFALHHGVVPRSIYDVQLAAGFAGLGGSLSLERLVEQALRVKLRHSEGFTDWDRRPLTEPQVEYAADDVRYLLDAADALERRLKSQRREGWALEEMRLRFGPDASLVQDPDQAWRRVTGRGKLRGEQLAVLVEVAAWREREARRRDIPCSWLVRDATLVEIARRRPRTPAAAESARGLKLKPGRQLNELLAAVQRGLGVEPERSVEMSSDVRARVRVILPLASSVLQACCATAGIASELVATRDDLESLIRRLAEGDGDGGHPLLEGWRRELAGEPLLRLLRGEVVLAVVPGPPHVAELPRA
ncbi:MAG: ribonuclease D [Gaiellales bacterium]